MDLLGGCGSRPLTPSCIGKVKPIRSLDKSLPTPTIIFGLPDRTIGMEFMERKAAHVDAGV